MNAPSFIRGLATVSAFGDSLTELSSAVKNKMLPSRESSTVTYQEYKLDLEIYKVPHFPLDIALKPAIERRLSFFSRMSIQAVAKAMQDSGDEFTNKNIGIIVGTSQGPTAVREKFNQKLYCEGFTSASPTLFANSVHNSTASFIAQQLNILGPTLTIVNHEASTSSALITANSWLTEKNLDFVFVIIGDEIYKKELSYLATKDYQKLQDFSPLVANNPVPGEGVACFILSNNKGAKYNLTLQADQSLRHMKLDKDTPAVIDFKGCPFSGPLALQLAQDQQVASYTKQLGSFPTVGALELALSCYHLQKGQIVASSSSTHPELNTITKNLLQQTQVQVLQTGKHNEIGKQIVQLV